MSENVRVAVRFRPPNKKEEMNSAFLKIDSKQNSVYISQPDLHDKKEPVIQQFNFDFVFDHTTNQEQLFDSVARSAVEWVCEGYNSTIFAYGCTSSGKSYTMFGHENGNKNLAGIIPRACETLFQIVNNNEDVLEATMKCSFLEIYREHIRDLLASQNSEELTSPRERSGSDRNELKIRQNVLKGVYIQGLTEKHVCSPQDILNTIKIGSTQRTVGSTALNSVSSRSHAVLTLNIAQKFTDGTETNSRLHLIDLAGSENVGRSEAQGITLSEAQTINKSLSCLGNVIYALTEKGREHIPYRDSKLTYLLQDSLGGNSKTIIIATASPAPVCYSETINTLKFAKRAKEIRNAPKINRNESVANLLKTIEELNKKIAELESKCEDSSVIIKAVESVPNVESKELCLYKVRCERLEKKIHSLEEIIAKHDTHLSHLKEFYEKQRELSMSVARKLYKEKVKNCELTNSLHQYELLYETIIGLINKPIILAKVLERHRSNKVAKSITEEESDTESILGLPFP